MQKKPAPAAPIPAATPSAAEEPVDPVAARAQAIFKASEDLKPFNPADFDFAIEDEGSFELHQTGASAPGPAPVEAAPSQKPPGRRILGMTPLQLAILAGLALAFLCIVAGFAYYIFALA